MYVLFCHKFDDVNDYMMNSSSVRPAQPPARSQINIFIGMLLFDTVIQTDNYVKLI